MITSQQSTNTLNWIKEKFKNERPLSMQEETELFKLIHDKDQPEMVRNSARAHILHANMRFVIQVSQQFYNDTLTPDELVNEGAIGLWRALESFDHTRGVHFITYAVWWIKAFIARAISEKGSLVRLPLNQQTRLHKEIKKTKDASEMSDDLKEINAIGGRHVSLSTCISEESSILLEDVVEDKNTPKVDQEVESELLRHFTNKLLSKIPEREQNILIQMYGLNGNSCKSIRDISHSMGLSRERIRQLRDQAVTRLRNLNCDGHLNEVLQETGCNPSYEEEKQDPLQTEN